MANSSSTAFPPLHNEARVFVVLEVAFILAVIALGSIGNAAVCAMVYHHRQLQTIANFLIMNLSVSDLLRIAFTLSVSSGVLIKRRWIYGEAFCRVNGCYTLVFIVASLMSVTLISVNRYYLIVRPNESAKFFSKRKTRFMVVSLWCLAVFIAIPPNLGWGHYGFFASRATCFIAVGSSYSYTSILVIAFIGVPFSILIWCYLKVYLAIKKSKQRVEESGRRNVEAPENSDSLRKEVKVAKTVLLLIGVYIITWIPICVIHFLRVARVNSIPDSVDLAAAFLMSISCVTNPWIYGFRHTQFRDQLRRMLCLKTRVRHIEDIPPTNE